MATTPDRGWRLEKWYADCVTPAGEVFIGYVAEVRRGGVRLRYAASLTQDDAGATLRQRQTLHGGCVTTSPGVVEVAAEALSLAGTWRGGTGTDVATVASTSRGSVTWQGLTLDADATVRVRGREYAGRGYAEVVRLTLPPWALPFADLRWGRFVADDGADALTWIATAGGAEFTGVWTPRSPARRVGVVADGAVRVDGGPALTWDAGRPIRRETVSRSLLGRLAPLTRLLPRGVRRLEEDKGLSRGVLVDEERTRPGWVLHERVRWR